MPESPKQDFLDTVLMHYPDVLWIEGCEGPRLKNQDGSPFVIGLQVKPDAVPKASQPFNLSEYDQCRVDFYVRQECALN